MHYASLNIGVRRKLDDQLARKFTLGDLGEALDEGAKFLQGELGIVKNRTSLSLVANQRQYTTSTTLLKPDAVYFLSAANPRELDGLGLDRFLASARAPQTATVPTFYHYNRSEGVIWLGPQPDTAAGTTTLTGSHNATITTFTVGSTTGFPTEGRGIVDSEVFSWENKTATTFTGVTRALEGTTAATHAGAATVTERDLLIYGEQRYTDRQMWTYYTTGSIAVTNATTTVTGTSTVWSTNVAAGDYFGYVGASGSDPLKLDPVKWYKITTVVSDTSLTLSSNFTQPTVSGSGVYIVSSPNPFPEELDPVLKAFALAALLKREGFFDRARMEWLIVERFLDNARKNVKPSDTTLISGTNYGSGRSGPRLGFTAYGQHNY